MGAAVVVLSQEQLEEIVERAIQRALAAAPRVAAVAPPPAPAGYMKVAAAAEYFSVAPETLREWIRTGKLPRLKAGKEWRVRKEDVEALLAHQPGDDLDASAVAAGILRKLRR